MLRHDGHDMEKRLNICNGKNHTGNAAQTLCARHQNNRDEP